MQLGGGRAESLIPRSGRPRVAAAVICASVVLGAGIGTALGTSANSGTEARQVDTGVSPSGVAYTISTIPDPYEGICFELVAPGVGSAEGCLPPPEVDGLSASQVLLSDELFVVAVGAAHARRLQVVRSDGTGRVASTSSIAVGSRRLLHAAMPAPDANLPRTELGLPVAPPVNLTVTDSSGLIEAEERLAIPLDDPAEAPAGGPRG